MPVKLVCPICGKVRYIKPSHQDKVFTCGSKECRSARMWQNFKAQLEQRIDAPVKRALYDIYVTQRKSYRYICRLWQINNRSLMKLMRDCGIEPRDRSEAVKTQWEGNKERRTQASHVFRQCIRDYYANGGQNASKRLDVRRKISEAKKRNNWMRGRTGSKHPLWQGGKIWWRGKDWDDLKEQMRKRDGYHCRRCGMNDQECIDTFGAPLQVHHILPYRLSQDNSPDNLKTLCNHCHSVADHAILWLL
jgi:hypothetical protein